MYILPPFMEEVLSEEIVKKDNEWNRWEYSRWGFSGWEFPGGYFPGGSLMGGDFQGRNFPRGNFPRTMLCIHFTQNCILCTFWRLKIFFLWQKIAENLLIFVHLFSPKNGAIDFTKTFITQEWLVVENCPTPLSMTFLMFYRLMYNIGSHFN